MNIKQKLTWAFAAIACLPVILVAVLVVLNLRDAAKANFLDSSGREIRQIDNGMKQFFDGIMQNVEFFAKDPRIVAAKDLKNYSGADAAQIPLPENNKQLLDIFDRFAKSHPTTAYLSLGLRTVATPVGRMIRRFPTTIHACAPGTRRPSPIRALP